MLACTHEVKGRYVASAMLLCVPQVFLIFGKTGWIGGLVADILKQQGATYHLASARLEDRAGVIAEIEKVGQWEEGSTTRGKKGVVLSVSAPSGTDLLRGAPSSCLALRSTSPPM